MIAPIGGDDDPYGDDVFGAETVERGAGDDREAGVSVIVQTEQRTHAEGRQSERGGQLRNHHAGRGANRVLTEIEQQAETPGDDESDLPGSPG